MSAEGKAAPAVETEVTSKYKQYQRVFTSGDSIPDEIPGDVFDRQRCVSEFDQVFIERQKVLSLGTGGVGNSVDMALVRMGVDTLHILDYDTVDATNLNRQILFSKADVGRRKVDAAFDALTERHNMRSKIHKHHFNAVAQWKDTVKLASQATAIFNNIDYGGTFDLAVSSLAKSLGIPYVAGSTYCYSVNINFYPGGVADPCFACNNSVQDSLKFTDNEFMQHFMLDNKESLWDVKFASPEEVAVFLLKTRKMSGQTCVDMIQTCFKHALLPSGSSILSFEAFNNAFCKLLSAQIMDALVPAKVASHDSLEFIPKDLPIPTRKVGSWVVPCTAGSLLVVNTWVQHMMDATKNKQVHEWAQIGLSCHQGCVDVCSFQIKQNALCKICTVSPK